MRRREAPTPVGGASAHHRRLVHRSLAETQPHPTMLTLRRLLVANDRGPCTARAYRHALRIAAHTGAEVHLVHVHAPTDALYDEPEVVLSSPPPEVRLHEATVSGDSVFEALLDYLHLHDIDLAVVGTHGRRGLTHLIFGSVAERLVREGPCPVLTVRACDDEPATGLARRILVPHDFSERADVALAHAAAVADLYDARVDLLHAVEPVDLPEAYGLGLVWDPGVPDLVTRSREALERLAGEHLGPARTGEVIVATGPPEAVILEAAEARRPVLIVMATHGRTGLQRFALGSVAERVVRYVDCPVLVVKSFGQSFLSDANASGAAEAIAP